MTGNLSVWTTPNSRHLFESARAVIPGGVNSPVRAFKSVGGQPLFIREADGAFITDEDGHRYIDFVGSWGPMILGHNHPHVRKAVASALEKGVSFGAPTRAETRFAEMIVERVPGVDMVRLVNSGTEATMSAVRLARAATGRDLILKFNGCYHGHADCFLIAAGSGAHDMGVPDSPGVPSSVARNTLIAPYNDGAAVRECFRIHGADIAAIIVEPIGGNAGCIPPEDNFLHDLRQVCDQSGALLIFDEVMTGFRVGPAGAVGRYGVVPDLITFGKIIGGGFPVGAYAGSRRLMQGVAPAGTMYQAGTLSGNPVAVAAGIATLECLSDETYRYLEELGTLIDSLLGTAIGEAGWPVCLQRVGSMFSIFFTTGPVRRIEDTVNLDVSAFARFFHGLLQGGFHIAPSPYESAFLSAAHTPEMISSFCHCAIEQLRNIYS